LGGPAVCTAATGLPAAFAGTGLAAPAATATRLPAAFSPPGARAAAVAPPQVATLGTPPGCSAVQSAGGTAAVSPAAAGPAALWAGAAGASPGLGAFAPMSEGAAMYAQHLEYTRYIAALQMQHAAAVSPGSAAAPPPSGGAVPAVRGGAWTGLKNHDPERRYQGIVCRWDEQAGFGFINDLESHRVYGRDVFLHAAQIDREADNYKRRRKIDIANGDRVMFMVEMDRGKPRARDVEIVERCGKREEDREASADDPPEVKRRRD